MYNLIRENYIVGLVMNKNIAWLLIFIIMVSLFPTIVAASSQNAILYKDTHQVEYIDMKIYP